MFMGIAAARPLDIDGLIRIDPATRHSIHDGAEAFGMQYRTVAILRDLLRDPIIDIIDEFTAPAVYFGDHERIAHFRASRVQFRERVRRAQ